LKRHYQLEENHLEFTVCWKQNVLKQIHQNCVEKNLKTEQPMSKIKKTIFSQY